MSVARISKNGLAIFQIKLTAFKLLKVIVVDLHVVEDLSFCAPSSTCRPFCSRHQAAMRAQQS